MARGNRQAWIVGDLPFGSYNEAPDQALCSAARQMQSGAQMVKLESGAWSAEILRFLVESGILGLTQQSVHAPGGWRVQGRVERSADTLRRHASELADAGASMLVLELPSALARSN